MPIELHILVLAFAVVYPALGFASFRKLLRSTESGVVVDRIAIYRGTSLNQWLLFVAGVLLYHANGQPWSDIGVRLPQSGSLVAGLAVVFVTIVVLWRQLANVRAGPDQNIRRYSRQLGKMSPVIPRRPDELRQFDLLAVTAGIVEEFLWRGLLIWYLSQFMAILPAAVLATLAFGVAHAYQGLTKVLQIILVGILLTGLYLYTRSLLLVVVLHIAIDLLQGRLAYEVVTRLPALVVLQAGRPERT